MSRKSGLALLAAVLVLSTVLLMNLAATPAMAAAPTVQVREDPTFGSILVNSKGMTLYQFTLDVNGKSRCFGICARYWPPLTVLAGRKPTAGRGVTGELGTVERPDGSLQVTYNGQPLYLNIKDTRAGDTIGQARNDHFFVVPVSGPPPTFSVSAKEAAETPTVELLKDPELGTILVDGNGMTLYVYNDDEIGKSNCTGKCAKTWPPLAVDDGVQPVAGAGITAELGVLERKDGINQVTFGGVPLYLYSKDYYPGDAMGRGMEDWFVAQIQ